MAQQPAANALGTDIAVTHILVVADPVRSRDFWVDVLARGVPRDGGRAGAAVRRHLAAACQRGRPHRRQADVVFAPPPDADRVSPQ